MDLYIPRILPPSLYHGEKGCGTPPKTQIKPLEDLDAAPINQLCEALTGRAGSFKDPKGGGMGTEE